MNKTFNIVWSAARNMYVVASEFASSGAKIKKQVRAIGTVSLLTLFSGPILAETTEVNNGETVNDTVLNFGEQQDVNNGGTAINTTINFGGSQTVNGGNSSDVTIDGDGYAYMYILSGIGDDITVSNGTLMVTGGTANNVKIMDDGSLVADGAVDGAVVTNAYLSKGGLISLTTDTTIDGIHETGGEFDITDHVATNVWLTGHGSLDINEDGKSFNTYISSGTQYVMGETEHTTIESRGLNRIVDTGKSSNSVINQGGTELIEGGQSSHATINGGGLQLISGGVNNESQSGVTDGSTVNSGGTMMVCGGEGACFDIERVYKGAGIARDTTVNNGGTLWLESANSILEGKTVIKTGAVIDAASGVITNNGTLDYDLNAGASRTEGNIIRGDGSLQKTGAGMLTLTGVNTYVGNTNVDEGTLWLSETGVIGAEEDDVALDLGAVYVASGATFGGSGVVNNNVLNNGNIAMSSAGETGHTLTINGDYTGNNGNLYLNTQLGDDNSLTDKLLIAGDTAGSTTVFVNNVGGQGALTTNGIEVIDVGGASNGVFSQGNQVQVGLYEYRLYKDGGDWYLRSQALTPVDPDDGGSDVTPVDPDDGGSDVTPVDPDDGGSDVTPVDPDDGGSDVTPVDPQYRADIGAYLGNQWMARNLQMQTLFDREGSQYRTDDGSMWMRFKVGTADSQAADGNIELSNNYSQIQLGGDVLAWTDGEQSLAAGLMASYITADTDSTGNRGADGSRFSSTGHVDGYNLGVYATWFADAKNHSGFYVDSWYQYGMYSNSVENGDVGSTDYDSRAHAASVETGYRHEMPLANGNSIGLTPQAQVTWQNYDADEVVDQNGSRINGQNSDSVTTRLGVRLDAKLHKKANIVQPFAELNWLHTSDEVSVSFDGAEVQQDLPADRAEIKAGIHVNPNSQWNITAQVVGQKGHNEYGDLSVGLNARYNW